MSTVRLSSIRRETGKKLDPIIAAFEKFCVGAVNVTYERYVFNKRMQDSGERFDAFLGDVRRLARSCQFEGVKESMIRDRIVVGIRNENTRHKLLQIRDLTLAKAIDVCKASEAAGKQLKVMTNADEVQSLRSTSTSNYQRRNRGKSRGREPRHDLKQRRDKSATRPCKYCDRKHEPRKEACPAYGKTCRRCGRQNHFDAVCLSKAAGKPSPARHDVNELDADEDLLALHDAGEDRWYSRLEIDRRTIRFLLDCGATANLIPESMIRAMGRLKELRPVTAKLRMFDGTALQTSGAITLTVMHPTTKKTHQLDFYVATKHEQPLLGFKACRTLDLLRVVDENICFVETPTTHGAPDPQTEPITL